MAHQEHLRLFPLEMDVTDEASVATAAQTILDQQGRVDVLINSAGIWGPGVLEGYTIAQWQHLFDVNVIGSVRAVRAFLPAMRAQKRGLIIQLSSLQGRFILPYSGPYVASKFAVEGALETFRYEVAPFGVEVCIIEPGDFMTEMKEKARQYTAADTDRTAAYGPVNDYIQQAYLTPNSQRSGDPMQVVDAIQTLIDAPDGERPLRTTVGNFLPQIEQINQLSLEMHQQLLPQLGLTQLLRVATDHQPL